MEDENYAVKYVDKFNLVLKFIKIVFFVMLYCIVVGELCKKQHTNNNLGQSNNFIYTF